MKKIMRLMVFTLLVPFFLTACNKSKPKPVYPIYSGDVSLITYDNTTIPHGISGDLSKLEVNSSDPNLFQVSLDSEKDDVIIESNHSNIIGQGEISFKRDGIELPNRISVAINYPQKIDEAYDALILAAMKLDCETPFEVTFNFYNTVKLNTFNPSLEIYGNRGAVSYKSYKTGNSITNTFSVDTNWPYGNIPSAIYEGDNYYEIDITSLNYQSRNIHNNESINDSFPIDGVKKTLDVENSEELFWAVEHGYKPNIIGGKKASVEQIYSTARSWCENINPSWSDLVKFRELYDTLINKTHYDYDPNLDEYGDNSMSYFLEGVFSTAGRGIAVCDGFAKAYALMCGIWGLPCFRSFGVEEGENVGHAWNYVQLDGSWYLVCPTWSKCHFSKLDEDFYKIPQLFDKNAVSLTNYDAFLASKNYFKNHGANYSDLAFPSVKRSDKAYSGNIDEINYYVKSDNDATNINNKIRSKIENKTYVYFECSANVSDATFESWINKIASNSKSLYGYCYSFYCEDRNSIFTLLIFSDKKPLIKIFNLI